MVDVVGDWGLTPEVPPTAEVVRQRAVSERLLMAALRERDVSTEAIEGRRRAAFLASASRELATSLDDDATRDAVRRRTLLREGSWCIVDIVEIGGAVKRLAVAHPNPALQARAERFAGEWSPLPARFPSEEVPKNLVTTGEVPVPDAARKLGFGGLLVAPMIVRGKVLGAMTFVAREGEPPFTPEETELASAIADVSALALDNSRLYRESLTLRAEADAANESKTTFLGNTSHELMTPLNAIGGYVTLLEMGLRGPVTAEQLVDLGRIRYNQTHLMRLIKEILTFARSETGRLEYHIEDVSAEGALREVAEMLEPMVAESELTLFHQPGDETVIARADPDRVRQILINLVTNAVKYASGGGGRLTLSTTVGPATVMIQVADDGPGIPAERLSAIFDPFVQLGDRRADPRGGVGLGLAISRSLARAMDGDLTVESNVGAGSRFTLTLPRAA